MKPNTRTEKLLALADFVLRTLESSEDWSAEETDAIAECAIELELATTDEDGYFRKARDLFVDGHPRKANP